MTDTEIIDIGRSFPRLMHLLIENLDQITFVSAVRACLATQAQDNAAIEQAARTAPATRNAGLTLSYEAWEDLWGISLELTRHQWIEKVMALLAESIIAATAQPAKDSGDAKRLSVFRSFDTMCWPVPCESLDDVAHALTYDHSTKPDRLIAASVISAYTNLISMPAKRRDAMVRDLRKGPGVIAAIASAEREGK